MALLFDLLSARAEEIVAMRTLTVLPVLLAPMMSGSTIEVSGFVAN